MNTNGKVLVVDGDVNTLNCLRRDINHIGFECVIVRSSEEALEVVKSQRPSIVIADLFLDGKDGISTLKEIKKIDATVVVILLTSNGHVSSATEAIRLGAFDYLQKPVSSKRLQVTILRALNYKYSNVQKNLLIYEKLEDAVRKFMDEKRNGEGRSSTPDHLDNPPPQMPNLIGQSQIMQEIFRKVARISQSNANVMIYGESGTGKELIARSIHVNSDRQNHALIPVDCVALPENLLESELFGYEKGAFTGAESLRRGLFEYAHEGTLFLDEIAELAPNLQAKLLRVLQEGEFRRVGGKRLIKVDMRIISATNIKPQHAIETGKLRQDLFYRLNVIPLEIPPLRERHEDVPILINYFLEKFSRFSRVRKKSIHPDVMDAFLAYHWPGNVRELQNLMEHLVSLIDGPVIRLSDLPEYLKSHRSDRALAEERLDTPFMKARKQVIQDFESEYLKNLIARCDGNISKAAQEAEVSRRTMYRLINTYNLHKHFTTP